MAFLLSGNMREKGRFRYKYINEYINGRGKYGGKEEFRYMEMWKIPVFHICNDGKLRLWYDGNSLKIRIFG